LKEGNGGIILDISEQGLAMQAVGSLGEDPYTRLRFQLSQSKDWIGTQGRIAWISPSRQTAGVEFIDLSFESLILIRNWISSITCPSASEEESAIPESVGPPESVLTLSEAANVTSAPAIAKVDIDVEHYSQGVRSGSPMNSEPLGVTSKPRLHIGLIVGVALSLLALISLGYSLRKSANGQPDEKARSSEEPSEVPPNGSSSPVIAPRAFTDSSSFILQVTATKDEKAAILLAGLLRQKGFPAFVLQPAAESLCRVFVGPYSDAASAAKVEGELRIQGFEVIRKRNTHAQ
jgi:hypothetical protein